MQHGAPSEDWVQGRTLSAIFLVWNVCSKEQRLWGSPQIKIMSSNFNEKIKLKKLILSGIKRGTRGEKDQIRFATHFLCLQSKSFADTWLFSFWISNCFVIENEGFQKNGKYWRIELIVRTQIQKIWLIHIFFIPGGGVDTWLIPRTCYRSVTEQILQKIWADIQFCQQDIWTCPRLEDISGTCPGHFQLRWLSPKQKSYTQ